MELNVAGKSKENMDFGELANEHVAKASLPIEEVFREDSPAFRKTILSLT